MNSLLQWNAPAVKKLLGWRRTEDEEKWAEKAVEALVKKLKKRNGGSGTLEDLEFALANPGSHSKCVTIPKSLDGRLQVSHKKGLPHVIYCRVWRWPDVTSHQELRAVPECGFPYESSSKSQHICINPYHYQRVEHSRMFSGYGNSSFSSPEPIPSPLTSSGSTCSPPLGAGSSLGSSPSEYGAAHSPSVYSEDGDSNIRQIPSPVTRMMPEPRYWATIGYYELNNRVGELFKVFNREVTIDGFTDPSNSEDRICLGLLSNVNRNGTIESTRKNIGRGIRLEYDRTNNLFIRNESEAAVFVQSMNCNCSMGQPPSAVCRVPPHHGLCIFDHGVFYVMLERARHASLDQLHELQKMCFIRLSFVKGWGPDYPRQDVTSTPCWMELRLHLPLSWIDQTIPASAPTRTDATSVS